jgi:hypothetical protein
VLFLRAEAEKITRDDWEFTYNCAILLNIFNLFITSDIQRIPMKLGWDYVWIEYEGDLDGAANVPVRRPIRAWLEAIYPFRDWTPLGIGTGPEP